VIDGLFGVFARSKTPHVQPEDNDRGSMQYRCEAVSVAGFVQQLVTYISSGYWFYVTGAVPERKDPRDIDRKLIDKYDLNLREWTRSRRKKAGRANVQYLRYGRFFVLIATHGEHRFFCDVEGEGRLYRDVRRTSIKFAGYSISRRRSADGSSWHTHVRIGREVYRELKAHLVELAKRRTLSNLTLVLRTVPFEPYAPVRRQLLNILRAMNRERKALGYEPVPISALRLHRRSVRPFGEVDACKRMEAA
jgi:hypothetical protein